MIVKKYTEVENQEVKMDGVKDTSIRWLIGEETNAPNFYTRLFEMKPGGHTPFHTHPWEHEIYVLEGKAQLNTTEGSIPLEQGSFALVLPGEEHQFENTGDSRFKFLCVIPKEGK
jgi:quercetin dioxygenase-like cupin family protein